MAEEKKEIYLNPASVSTHHPDYDKKTKAWVRVRDCLEGEDTIKSKEETYLPRPAGMSGDYADAYDSYIERAHFPLIVSYALSGALGIVITKLPEFNVPKGLEYILKEATKDGRSLTQLFLDVIIEVFETGRVPLLVDIDDKKNEFKFIQYAAEELINWKTSIVESEEALILGVLNEALPSSDDIFSHETEDAYRVLTLDASGTYVSKLFDTDSELEDFGTVPSMRGKFLKEVPLVMAGSINNSFAMQPIPLVAVANASIQIYRKEADLANSEFLSCNPTLVLVGASNDDELPNVVGSSVMMVLPNDQARVFYTKTDTAALKHVKDHITGLYEEAIRHGVAILDARKGVEAAEALRIRQSTQSASIYSIYLSALNAIRQGLQIMCKWGGFNEEEIEIDAPSALTHGIPDSAVLKEIIAGFGEHGVVPLTVIHRYLVSSGLLEQTVGYEDYLLLLEADRKLRNDDEDKVDGENKSKDDIEKDAQAKKDADNKNIV